MDIEISAYFRETLLNQELGDYIERKKVHITQPYTNTNRSICQMMRTVNLLTKYEYEHKVALIMNYLRGAVLKLSQYKEDWAKYLKEDSKNNMYKGRSAFTGEKRERALELLHVKSHDIFVAYHDLYVSQSDPNIQNYILECIYYTQQINKKLLDYERKLGH